MDIDTRWARGVALILFLVAGTAVAEESRHAEGSELHGVVERIKDGDSLVLRTPDAKRIEVRLCEIDAPEMSQPYGPESKRALQRLAQDRSVRMEVVDTDRYGRTVGAVFLEGAYLNGVMVQQGHAWAYTRYARSTAIIELENEARAAMRGLWALPESKREAPWIWRSGRKGKAVERTDLPMPEGCGAKRKCGEMSSCAEAEHYLKQCGLSRLDGDGDGVPCEALCGGR